MSDLNSATWHELDSANTDAPPDGWPEGQPANSVNNCARAGMGALKRFYDRINATVTSTGSANAHTLTYTVAPTALVKGDTYSFIAGFTNTGATTLNVGVGGAKPILVGATALSAGSITVGCAVEVMYDGTNFQFTGWDAVRPAGQNLVVNTLTATGAGTAINASAGDIVAAGNIRTAGSFVTTTTGGLFLGGTYVLFNGNTTLAAGPYYSADNSNHLIRIGPGGGALYIETSGGAVEHVFDAAGNVSHNGTIYIAGAATLNSTLGVTSNVGIGGTLTVNSTATILGAASVGGTLAVTGAVTTSGNLSVNGGNIFISGVNVLAGNALNTGYTVISDNAGRNSIYMGSGDATNYYRQTQHLFQSQSGGGTWLTLVQGSFHATQNATFDGNITANSYVNALDVLYTHSTGVIYQNVGSDGFNFRWDGSHVFTRVNNAVEYPIYSANGGTVSGDITANNLTVTDTVTANSVVNTTTYQTNGHTLALQDGTYNVLYRLDGAPGLYLGNNGSNFFRNTTLNFDNGSATFAVMTASGVTVTPLLTANGGVTASTLLVVGTSTLGTVNAGAIAGTSGTFSSTVSSTGYNSRGGLSGSFTGNYFNFQWTGGHIYAWIDVTNEGYLVLADGSNNASIAGTFTAGGLTTGGTVTASVAVNTVTYQLSGGSLADRDATYNQLYRRDGSVGIYLGNNGINYFRNTQLVFDNGGAAFMVMDSSGNLSNVPVIMSNNIAIQGKESGGTARNMLLLNASDNLVIGNATTSLVDIDSGGNVTVTATGNFVVSNNDAYKPGGGSWQAISDMRVKDDVRDYEVGLEALKLRPVTYKLNGKGGTVADGREFVGLVADEVEPIMPEMVGKVDDDELGEVKTLNTNALTYALLNVCKKLEARLAALEAK